MPTKQKLAKGKLVKTSIKQETAYKHAVENGGNITKAMREAKYSESTINNPSNLTESDGWLALLEKHAPDDKLALKLEEGLSATKQIGARKIVQGARVGHEIKVDATTSTDDFIDVEDYAIRHKYLETALKLKRRLSDKLDVTSGGDKIEGITVTIVDAVHGGDADE